MSRPDGSYAVTLVAGQHRVELLERARSEEELTLELQVDGANRGNLRLVRDFHAGVAIGADHILVWGGTDAYVAPLHDGRVTRVDAGDLIDAAYPFGSIWVVACELSVILLDPWRGIVFGRCRWDEVLLRSWWSSGELHLEDLRGRHLRLEITNVQSKLTLVDL